MADTPPKTDPNRESLRQPARWLPLLIAAIAACLVAGCGYYALKFMRGGTVNDERAFRTLGEITGQFDNLQETMASLLQLVPKGATADNKLGKRYVASLALEGLQLAVTGCGNQASRPVFAVDASGSSRQFSVTRCFSERSVTLSGDLLQHLPTFIVQEFFDDVILATAAGTIVAQVHGRSREELRIELQDTRAEGLTIADARALLHQAAANEDTAAKDGKQAASPAVASLSHPVVFDDVIAGADYRVFVQPFEPRHALDFAGKPDGTLYLIGLRHQNVMQSLSAALGPNGRLAITALVLLTIVGWPLLSLKFSSPQDSISPAQVVAVVIALLLIPAVLTILGFSSWSHQRLGLWADRAAENYAYQVESELLKELNADVHTLDELALEYAKVPTLANSTVVAQFREREGEWPRLHNIAALDRFGRSSGPTFNLYDLTTVERDLDLHDREYFKALAIGEEWKPGSRWDNKQWHELNLLPPAYGFVAQRLFNRTDAARVLQIAVPQFWAGARTGVVTGDSRTYALSASIRPPLLRFAIIDSSNGTVLFHSNDKRSLAENLLVETQANASLRAAMSKRASRWNLNRIALEDHFDSDYMGEPHRFYYRPVSGVPWGIVVFYAREPLGVAVLQTANATLATYFAGAAILILLVSGVIVAVSGRPDLELLAWLWPQWRRYPYYGSYAIGMLMLLALLATFALARLNGAGYITAFLALLVVAAGSVLIVRMRRSSSERSVQRWQNEFVCCMVCVMCIVAVLPTIWLAVDYHDASVRALIGDELKQAGDDIEHRYRVMARDLRHAFDDGTGVDARNAEASRRMDPRTFSMSQPVPGFANHCTLNDAANTSRVWEVNAFPTNPWLSQAGPPALDLPRSVIWTLSTDRHLQPGRSSNDAYNVTQSAATEEEKRNRNSCAAAAAEHVVLAWFNSDDGYRIKVALPLVPAVVVPFQHDRELGDLRYPWSSDAIMMAVAALLVLLLTALSWHVARRLFGIRIPFAGRFVSDAPDRLDLQPLLQAEFELLDLKKSLLEKDPSTSFTAKDESDWRASKCLAVHRAMWATLSPDEQLLMHQLSRGKFANPENRGVIENLLRRGYLQLRPWPRIVESGFAEFARTAASEQQFAALQRAASRNLWTVIRIPLFIIVVIVTASMMLLAGSAMQILSTTLAGVGTLFGVITQVTNFVRKDSKPAAS